MFKLIFIILFVVSCGKEVTKVEPPPPYVFPPPIDKPLPPVPNTPNFVNFRLVEDIISLDLQAIPSRADRENTRYIVSCHRLNTGKEIESHYQAVNLVMNRLSNQRFLTKATRIGRDKCIFRINLADYGLDKFKWGIVENFLLFRTDSESVRAENLRFLTQTANPWVFTEELCNMLECDEVAERFGLVYYTLTDQPNDTEDWLRDLGVDLDKQAEDQTTVCAGFQKSQIALSKGRLICINESDNGYVMSTYDTILGNDTVFINPYTPEIARVINTKKVLQFNAQEHIASNLNGLFGLYRLNNADGEAEIEAPTNLVGNTLYPHIDPSIRAAGDCGACHYSQVAIPFKDDLAREIKQNFRFDANEKLGGEIFFSQDRMQAIADKINRADNQAMGELGVTWQTDPISSEVFLPIRQEMDIDFVASFLFMSVEEFRVALQGDETSAQALGNLLSGSTVSLENLNAAFPDLINGTGAYRDPEL